MIRGLRAAFYDTAENAKYKFMVILQINLFAEYLKEEFRHFINTHRVSRIMYHLGTPIKFTNEIIHLVIAQFTNQTGRVMEIWSLTWLNYYSSDKCSRMWTDIHRCKSEYNIKR